MCCKLFKPAWLLSLLLLLDGCAAAGRPHADYLLDQDYQRLSNAELTAYEQELSEEIARGLGSGGGGTSVGFGVGSWGSDAGFGIGVNQILGVGSDDGAVKLRDRREAVRVEMRRRGLLPATDAGK
jgi:hypothetical protein